MNLSALFYISTFPSYIIIYFCSPDVCYMYIKFILASSHVKSQFLQKLTHHLDTILNIILSLYTPNLPAPAPRYEQ